MLKWFPKLLNDIYLSEEYYGENVLHMGCVAEDASLVKWLLDIGSDFHRRCYGNFFCCDDQKVHRMDNLQHEEVDIEPGLNTIDELGKAIAKMKTGKAAGECMKCARRAQGWRKECRGCRDGRRLFKKHWICLRLWK